MSRTGTQIKDDALGDRTDFESLTQDTQDELLAKFEDSAIPV